jgi:hypothetical protein
VVQVSIVLIVVHAKAYHKDVRDGEADEISKKPMLKVFMILLVEESGELQALRSKARKDVPSLDYGRA